MPTLRYKMKVKFDNLGGNLTSIVSKKAIIGNYDVLIDNGNIIMNNVVISNRVLVGIGCIVYYNTTMSHYIKIGDFVNISIKVTLLGNCIIGDFSHIGASVTILPKVEIGKNAKVGSGAVVTKSIPDNVLLVGVPAKIVKYLKPLEY